jgi:hypothetical protein
LHPKKATKKSEPSAHGSLFGRESKQQKKNLTSKCVPDDLSCTEATKKESSRINSPFSSWHFDEETIGAERMKREMNVK